MWEKTLNNGADTAPAKLQAWSERTKPPLLCATVSVL